MSIIRQRSAQSLLEAILAIGVILTATISATTLIVTTITTGQISKDNIQAANFAREGVEVIRGLRDSNWLRRQQNVINPKTTGLFAWDDNPTDDATAPSKLAPNTGSRTWYVVWDATLSRWKVQIGVTPTLGRPNGQLYFTQNCGTNCTNSKFSRAVAISKATESTSVGDIEYLNIVSTVTWQNRGTKTYSITERLYDWR